MTEVRPDAYIFDDGLHFEVRPIDADNQLIRKSIENLNEVYIDVHTFPIHIVKYIRIVIVSVYLFLIKISFSLRQFSALREKKIDFRLFLL